MEKEELRNRLEELIVNIQELSSYIISLNEGMRLIASCGVKNKDLHIMNSLEIIDILSNNIDECSSNLILLLKNIY